MANWNEMLLECMESNKDSMDNIIHKVPDNEDTYTREFDDGYGILCGLPFTIWTNDYVYFPVRYDGAEWVSCVPRNPCDEATDHI
jgi:hypothetical protein